MSIYQPYTYLIGWSSLNKWYYGVRYAKGCNPSDFWVKYFTSSKNVKLYRKIHGDPDIIQIRKTFDNPISAILWEQKVLQKLNVVQKDEWLNQSVGGDKPFFYWEGKKSWNNGIPWPTTIREKISQALQGENHPNYGKKHKESTKQKMSLNNASKRPEMKKMISERQQGSNNSFYGKKHSEHSKRLKSEKNKGYYWWTDNVTEVKSKICPPGFTRGRKPKS